MGEVLASDRLLTSRIDEHELISALEEPTTPRDSAAFIAVSGLYRPEDDLMEGVSDEP